jgi:pyruvate formate lyase activating enzyme
MTDPDVTSVATLIRAAGIGKEEGLHYVYAGNMHGRAGEHENTRCHGCGTTLVRRSGFTVLSTIIEHGSCPSCQCRIPGRWM